MELLEVNGVYLDLEPDQITRQIRVASIADLTTRRSSYSNQFKLKKTARNVKALDGVGIPGSTSAYPYTELRVNYSIDSIPIVVGGYMSIESDDKDYYYVRVKDGLISLSSRMEDLTLQDLPLSEYNHYLSANNVINSFSNTEGYIYAVADYGLGFSQVEYMAPCVFVSTIWQAIFDLMGVSYSGDFFENNTDFKSEVITPSVGILREDVEQTETYGGDAAAASISISEVSTSPINASYDFPVTSNNYTGFSLVDGELIAQQSKTINISATSNITLTGVDVFAYLLIKVNGETKVVKMVDSSQTLTFSATININAGDVLSFGVTAVDSTSLAGKSDYRVDVDIDLSTDFYEITGGSLVELTDVLEDMDLSSFVSDIMNRYGLFITKIDEDAQVYEFKQIEEILSDTATAFDWTDKLSGFPENEYLPDVAQSNTFTYSYNENYSTTPYDGEIVVNNFYLDEEDEMHSSPFEIPTTAGRLLFTRMFSVPIFEEDDDGEVSAEEDATHIMRITRVNGTIEVTYFDEVSTSFTGDVPFLSLENMGMQYFIDNYYAQYSILLNKYKEITVDLNLNPVDVYSLRFDRLYFFRQLGRYYFLNQIKHSTSGVSTGTFVEIPEFS